MAVNSLMLQHCQNIGIPIILSTQEILNSLMFTGYHFQKLKAELFSKIKSSSSVTFRSLHQLSNCLMTNHTKTQWLKTTTIIYFVHKSAVWVGLSWVVPLCSTQCQLGWPDEGLENPFSIQLILCLASWCQLSAGSSAVAVARGLSSSSHGSLCDFLGPLHTIVIVLIVNVPQVDMSDIFMAFLYFT